MNNNDGDGVHESSAHYVGHVCEKRVKVLTVPIEFDTVSHNAVRLAWSSISRVISEPDVILLLDKMFLNKIVLKIMRFHSFQHRKLIF